MKTANKNEMKGKVNALYLMLLALYLGYRAFFNTMIRKQLHIQRSNVLENIWMLLMLGIIAVRLFYLKSYSLLELAVALALGCCCFLAYRVCWTKWLELFPFAVIAAKDVPFDKIIKAFLIPVGGIILAAMLGSIFGPVTDLWYMRVLPDGTLRGRHSYGTTFPTTFSEFVFFLSAAWLYMRRRRANLLDVFGLVCIGAFLKVQCDAKTDAICVILLAALALFLFVERKSTRRRKRGKMFRILTFAFVPVMPLCALAMVLLTVFYDSSKGWMVKIDALITERLRVGHEGFLKYGIHLFGSKVKYVTTGGDVNKDPGDRYFNFDCSYLLILVNFGLLVFLILMAFLIVSAFKAWKIQNIALLVILAIIALECVIENRLMQPQYNVFCLMFFANMQMENET